jgi:hypothetical protein
LILASIFQKVKSRKKFFQFFLNGKSFSQFLGAFFFQTQEIPENAILFDQKPIDINFIDQSIDVIQELDAKKQKIRSIRGFFLSALEIMENGKEYEIFFPNLQPFFWRKVQNIIRQNQKAALQEFLVGVHNSRGCSYESSNPQANTTEDLAFQLASIAQKIESPQKSNDELRSQLNSPQNRIHELETQNLEMKTDRKMLSKAPRSPKKVSSRSQQIYLPSSNKDQNGSNFIPLGKISEEDSIEIIKTGFRLNQEREISWKKYYESTDEFCAIIEDQILPIPDLYYTFKAKDFSSAIDDLYLEIDRYDPNIDDWD